MENEVSNAMSLGTMLIAVSAVIFIVMATVFIGDAVRVDGFEAINHVKSDTTIRVLDDLVGLDNEMSTAAAYNLLERYGNMIVLDCNICGVSNQNLSIDSSCLLTHLNGTVYLQVEKVSEESYKVIVHKHDCTWVVNGVCTCH